jgi:glycosyltransferase involved in cell wall biosynthesis
VPLRISQGIQNKILEALAAGLPVVTTPVAAAGLEVSADLPLAVASDPDDFARRVCDFLEGSPLSRDRMDACLQDLQDHYDWDRNFAALDALLTQIQARNRSSRS